MIYFHFKAIETQFLDGECLGKIINNAQSEGYNKWNMEDGIVKHADLKRSESRRNIKHKKRFLSSVTSVSI